MGPRFSSLFRHFSSLFHFFDESSVFLFFITFSSRKQESRWPKRTFIGLRTSPKPRPGTGRTPLFFALGGPIKALSDPYFPVGQVSRPGFSDSWTWAPGFVTFPGQTRFLTKTSPEAEFTLASPLPGLRSWSQLAPSWTAFGELSRILAGPCPQEPRAGSAFSQDLPKLLSGPPQVRY